MFRLPRSAARIRTDATRHYCEEIDLQIETEARRANFRDELLSDLRIALRGMRRTPIFAAVVLLTLAVGIGANTAVFSVVRRILIAPLPFRSPGELYRLYTTPAATDGDDDKLSAVELTALGEQSRSLAGVTLFGNYAGIGYADDHISDVWQTVSVAPNFFDVLGLRPVAGRVFGADDFVQGAPSAVMISYQLWQRVFAGDRGTIGRTVQLDGKPFTIVGILPEEFVGPTFTADVLRPLNVNGIMRNPQVARSRVWRSVVRLKPGVSLERFQSELAVMRARLQASHPEIRNAGVFLPRPLHEAIVGAAGPVLRLVMAGALIVLCAACMNIAGLFLSRAASRKRELAVRTALGASGHRLLRHVIAETVLYGVLGGAIGVLLAVYLKAALLRVAGPMLPSLGDVTIDGGVLAFAFIASTLAGIAFGILPGVAAARVDLRSALGDGARSATRGALSSSASRWLVAAQVAFATVLVVGAILFVRTFRTLLDADLGYATTEHQATFFLSLGPTYREPATEAAFVESFLQRVHGLPGVTAAGHTVTGPWNGAWRTIAVDIVGRTVQGADRPAAVLATASSEFFAAADIALRAGRSFASSDRVGTPPVVVISESMAQRFWPNASPIGAKVRINISGIANDSLADREIVGVVSDVRTSALADPSPTLYVSGEQTSMYGATYIVRTTGDAAALLPSIRQIVHQMDPRVVLVSPRTMKDVLANLVRRQNVAMTLIGMFAILALLLAALGVYGVMAYSVLSRARELGIRSALGATRRRIVWLVLREGMTTTLLGVVAGVLIAAGLSRLVRSLLVGVAPNDPLSFAIAVAVLGGAALVACALPARAAARVQPLEALRLE